MSSDDEKSPMQLGFEFAPVSAAASAPGLVVARKAAALAAVVSTARRDVALCVPLPLGVGEKRRPGRCYRAADVAWPRILDRVGPGGKDSDACPGSKFPNVLEADLAEPGAELVGRDPDRRLRPAREREDGAAARGRDPAELLEERDH